MFNFMRIPILYTILILSSPGAIAQNQDTLYSFKDVGWTIHIPTGFTVIDSTVADLQMKNGVTIFEKILDTTVEKPLTRSLIYATKGQYEMFDATITSHDTTDGKSWETKLKSLKNADYQIFTKLIENATIDSLSNIISIDGVSFDNFKLRIKMNGKVVLTSDLLSKLYNGYDFSISYMYVDDKTKEQIETMLMNSKFSR